MNISIFGLGYVGCVSLGCLAKYGHNIVGIDINEDKVDLINQGKPTIIEKEIDQIIRTQHGLGKISATVDYITAVKNSEISIICVGTPSTPEGHPSMDQIYRVSEQIGEGIREKQDFHIILIRSTVPPGTNQKAGQIINGSSGKQRNTDFTVISNPEFLREGSAVEDYFNPAITVLGGDHDAALDVIEKIYEPVNAPVIKTGIAVAELIKYINNSFHALKVTFANEVGNICKKLGIDSHELMDLFIRDHKLNISPAYLKPGFAYGGSCLPKDLKALNTMAYDQYLQAPVLNAIESSNEMQISLLVDMIVRTKKKKIGIIGISFKAGTDDLRFSPVIEVIERLTGKGFQLAIFDKNVNLSIVHGVNRNYIFEKLPHINHLIQENIEALIDESEVIVISHKEDYIVDLDIPPERIIIDLVRMVSLESHPNYQGLCW